MDKTSVRTQKDKAECRILYVEDDPASRNLLKRAIRLRTGLELCLASSLKEAHEQLANRPNIILLDFHLPDGNGYELLAFLHSHQEYADIPVIAVSASAMSEEISRGLAAGLQHYLTKPFDLNELFSVIDALC